ncbi:hypothetical protein BDN71DRAFT_1511245 [Pleurotus eryngii]|uniref:F-box domain-containing protein n=1 Tax=Pleurotus eryngii TaxID=5323 RepID=A0A9P5ZPU6_PLEER|nr:hypothetical protein BDN71DRAFT_1511245 [Pleurotus eryngii]
MSRTIHTEWNSRSSHNYPKQLPVELIIEIIAIVAKSLPRKNNGDPPKPEVAELTQREAHGALATASLVSREWNTISRRYILSRVDISTNNSNARLAFLCFEAPLLSENIR